MKDAAAYWRQEALCAGFRIFGLDLKGPPPAISTWGPLTRFQAQWKTWAYDRFAEHMPANIDLREAVLYAGKKRVVLVPIHRSWAGWTDFSLGYIALPSDADVATLGQAICDALQMSVFDPDDHGPKGRDAAHEAQAQYLHDLRNALSIGAKAALWKDLKQCALSCQNDVVTVEATSNEGRDSFAFPEPQQMFAAPRSAPDVVGTMARLALWHSH